MCLEATRSAPETGSRDIGHLRLAMINAVAQPHCTSRAEWRLQTGKPAKSLSPHYRLDCDYGTPVIMCWKEGGSEPIYVCDGHAKELGSSREHCPDAYVIRTRTEQSGDPTKFEDRTQTQDVTGTKSDGSASSEAVRSVADTKLGRAMLDIRDRRSVRDLTYGNSAKAMVDEAIWNMATGDVQAYRTALREGKSPGEAAEVAGGQLAIIHRKINDYNLKLEAVLSKLPGTINVEGCIDKPIEQAMLEIIKDDQTTDGKKEAAILELGKLQEWMKNGLHGDITPLQANRIVLAIGGRLNWGGNCSVSENFKPVYRALYGRLKTAIRTTDPEAQNLYDRLTNLYAAKSEIEER